MDHILAVCLLLIVGLLIALLWVLIDIRIYLDLQIKLMTRLEKTVFHSQQALKDFNRVANELTKTRKQP